MSYAIGNNYAGFWVEGGAAAIDIPAADYRWNLITNETLAEDAAATTLTRECVIASGTLPKTRFFSSATTSLYTECANTGIIRWDTNAATGAARGLRLEGYSYDASQGFLESIGNSVDFFAGTSYTNYQMAVSNGPGGSGPSSATPAGNELNQCYAYSVYDYHYNETGYVPNSVPAGSNFLTQLYFHEKTATGGVQRYQALRIYAGLPAASTCQAYYTVVMDTDGAEVAIETTAIVQSQPDSSISGVVINEESDGEYWLSLFCNPSTNCTGGTSKARFYLGEDSTMAGNVGQWSGLGTVGANETFVLGTAMYRRTGNWQYRFTSIADIDFPGECAYATASNLSNWNDNQGVIYVEVEGPNAANAQPNYPIFIAGTNLGVGQTEYGTTVFFSHVYGGDNYVALRQWDGSRVLQINTFAGSDESYVSSTPQGPNGDWIHRIAISFSSAGAEVYWNGEQVVSVTTADGWATYSQWNILGMGAQGRGYTLDAEFNKSTDSWYRDYRVWCGTNTLTQAQLEALTAF